VHCHQESLESVESLECNVSSLEYNVLSALSSRESRVSRESIPCVCPVATLSGAPYKSSQVLPAGSLACW